LSLRLCEASENYLPHGRDFLQGSTLLEILIFIFIGFIHFCNKCFGLREPPTPRRRRSLNVSCHELYAVKTMVTDESLTY